jgi:hypothetical protein
MSEIDIQGDDALVQLLLNADKGDIDLLIDYVTNTGKLGFSMSDSVKNVLQDAKRQDIPDEETCVCLFGSCSISVVIRS